MARILLFISLIFVALFSAQSSDAYYVEKIVVKGNKRISSETIRAYLTFEEKDEIDENDINDSVKQLYKTGYFQDIKITQVESSAHIFVVENAFIKNVIITGNKAVTDADIKAVLLHRKKSVFSEAKLQAEQRAIRDLYQRKGLIGVQIVHNVESLDDGINLQYTITEGSAKFISKIRFDNNNAFSDRKLRGVIASRQKAFWRFFSSVDKYDHDRLEFDAFLLKQHYLNRGYYDFEVIDQTVTQNDDGNYDITFVLHEGERYKIDNIEIKSQIDLDLGSLPKSLPLKRGKVFSEELVFESVMLITDYFNDRGYAFVDVVPLVSKNTEKQTIDIDFEVERSPKIYINRINIKNNVRTLDKVIRREIILAEGDPYNSTKIKRSIRNIKNLGYFSNVTNKNNRSEDFDRVDVDIEVEEASTGSANIGVTYTTGDDSGVGGLIGFKERNFLGTGLELALDAGKSQNSTNFSFGILDPYFMDKKLRAGFQISRNTVDRSNQSGYKYENYGFGLSGAYDIMPDLTHTIRYNYKNEKLEGIKATASRFIREQEGTNKYSIIGHSLTYNKLDDDYDPTDGYAVILSQEYAGVGGTVSYLKHGGKIVYYYPIQKDSLQFKMVNNAGHIKGFGKKGVRLNDRFFLGQEDIRGFESSGIGARDSKTREALGGEKYFVNKIELISGLGLPKEIGIKGYVFHDIGVQKGVPRNIDISEIDYKGTFRASYGFGLYIDSPLGPLVVDWGFPYKKESFDKERLFRISYKALF